MTYGESHCVCASCAVLAAARDDVMFHDRKPFLCNLILCREQQGLGGFNWDKAPVLKTFCKLAGQSVSESVFVWLVLHCIILCYYSEVDLAVEKNRTYF